ncbi:MAG: hypothetical protein JXL97_06585 [Bacteroidales bacterium]|nr:hypothetical protein [Bacteroidales bacterium]
MALRNKKRFEQLFEQSHSTEMSDSIEKLLKNLQDNLTDYSKVPFSFNDFIFQLNRRPELILRDVYQLFSDAVQHHIKIIPAAKRVNKLQKYDMTELFQTDTETPFFADRLFARRFMQVAEAMGKGVQTNRIYIFEGPPGSGKSTFLNNLLNKIQEYTQTPEGLMLKTVWHLDMDKIGDRKSDFWNKVEELAKRHKNIELIDYISSKKEDKTSEKFVDISCPYNDHPILQIPKEYRRNFLATVIEDKEFKHKLFNENQYSWIFKEEACHICTSVYDSLYDILNSPVEILQMLNAKIFNYSRKFGYGISIFNPGDNICRNEIENQNMQNMLHKIFNNDKIQYVFSPMAYTNNGVYAIMDMKESNIQRFKDLHSIISDGVNKVNVREEKIKSVFLAIINPEDRKHFSQIQSFKDRIITVRIPYVLDYEVVMKILKYKFGKVQTQFLPEVFESFTKVIVATRLEKKNELLKKLLSNVKNYPFLDEDLILLKMELYSGSIPQWLSDKDRNSVSEKMLDMLTSEAKNEGFFGISGRQELTLFNQFFSKYSQDNHLIEIQDVIEFFNDEAAKEEWVKIPDKFLDSLRNFYNYTVLQQVKECLYFYNREQIGRDILNYLYAINFEIGNELTSPYTKDKFTVTEDFFKNFEAIYLGTVSGINSRLEFRKKQQKEYVTHTLSQEIKVLGVEITKTTQFRKLFIEYTTNLKQNALAPYVGNENFRRALLEFGKKDFEKYDKRMKLDINRLIVNMKKRFGYNKVSAIHTILYILEKKK